MLAGVWRWAMDVVERVRQGQFEVDWATVVSSYRGHTLEISVFRDSMKFDEVRLPSTATQLQQICDILDCSMLTPLVCDLIWQQSSLRFDAIVNAPDPVTKKTAIVADLDPIYYSSLVDAKIRGIAIARRIEVIPLVESVGKYWVLSNRLLEAPPPGVPGKSWMCCNYGWFSSAASTRSVTGAGRVWQSEGIRHARNHVDASQGIRAMAMTAVLTRPDGSKESVRLDKIWSDPNLAGLLNHSGVLKVTRQPGVDPDTRSLVSRAVEAVRRFLPWPLKSV